MGKSDTTSISADIIVIDHKGKILMQLRDKEGEHSFRDCWALPGGAVEFGESSTEGVVREFKEETGCTCKPKLIFITKQKREFEEGEVNKYVFYWKHDGTPIECLEGQKFEFKTFEEIQSIKNKNPHSEILIKRFLKI